MSKKIKFYWEVLKLPTDLNFLFVAGQSGVDRMQILEVLLLCFCSDCWFGSLQATYDQSDSSTFRIYGKI